ncbi:MAG: tetrahydrofolate dehydrogenase/cyclohydrolase catalytic domain-containing protein [Acidimicrobiales bacterium]
MTAQLLAGQPVADSVLADVKTRTEALAGRGVVPGLGTILVGDDAPSAGYVAKKHETCAAVGIRSHHRHLPASAGQAALLDAVAAFNADPEVHAYLVQLPLPDGYDLDAVLSAIDPAKDADGLHPTNLGKLVLSEPAPVPCAPAGIQAMLVHYGIETAGRHAVVIGRGPTLGRPMGLLLGAKGPGADCAVTTVHSAVPNLTDFTRAADIVVAALGRPNAVTPDMVRPGAVVVSGGISWEGRKLLPDVAESVGEVASWITPRLGGVGPTTVAMLLRNTVIAAEVATQPKGERS